MPTMKDAFLVIPRVSRILLTSRASRALPFPFPPLTSIHSKQPTFVAIKKTHQEYYEHSSDKPNQHG